MRIAVYRMCFALALGAATFGCGSPSGSTDAGVDSGVDGGFENGATDDGGTDGGTDSGTGDPSSFQIAVPPVDVAIGEEEFRCLHTSIDVGRAAGISRWSSSFTAGIFEIQVYFVANASRPEGTLEQCATIPSNGTWMYGTLRTPYSLSIPDGAAIPMAQPQPAVVRIHYLNGSAATVSASATITGELRPAGEAFTQAAAYLTLDTRIAIPPASTGSVTGSCGVPSGASFFALTTYTHKASTRTEVRDGTTVVFQSTDWNNPGDAQWGTPPHHVFTGNLGYTCEYNNPTNAPVTFGDGEGDEACMVIAYFFPATGNVMCVNGTVLP